MNRRRFLTALASVPFVNGCSLENSFTFNWREEILLSDGRTIVANLKYTYVWMSSILGRHGYEPSILKSSELSFNAGGPIGLFKHVFPGHLLVAILPANMAWFLIIERRGSKTYEQTSSGPSELWGNADDFYGHKYLKLDSSGLSIAEHKDLAGIELKPNVLLDNGGANELAKFDKTLVTLDQKAAYLADYPMNPLEYKIELQK